MKNKFAIAMAVYVVLAIIACIVLHGKLRWAMLIFFGLLAVKTLIAHAAGWTKQ